MESRTSYKTIWTALSISILLLLTSNSCAFWDFFEPEIVTLSPDQNQLFADTNAVSALSVTFSAHMNHFSVENALQLKKINQAHFDEVSVAGTFEWKQNGLLQETIAFIPRESLEYGKYRLDVSIGCEDLQGNNISHATNIYFQIGADETAPVLLSINPADGALDVSNVQNIILVFDEPVNTDTLPESFSLDPGENFIIHASSNNTHFELKLLDKMSSGLHTLTVSALDDIYGNTQDDDSRFYFTVGSDFIAPAFVGMYSNCAAPALITNTLNAMDKNQDLYFVFSEDMDIDINNIPVSLSPALDGIWTLNSNTLHFVPTDSWEIDRPYSLTVKQGIKDLAGNETALSYHYQVAISSPLSYYVDLLEIRILTNVLNPQAINKITLTNDITNELSLDIHLQFSNPLKDYTVLENVSVSYVSGSSLLVSPYISTVMFSNSVFLKDTPILRIKDMSYYNLYKLTIKGGRDSIQDTNDNWIKQDIEIYFRPEL